MTSFLQYYYAHAPKSFDLGGAQHDKNEGKIYDGQPVLIKSKTVDGAVTKVVAVGPVTKKIAKYSWADEEAKVKVYVDLS